MSRYLVGIDGGSQSSKVSIFDETGHVVSEAREPLRPSEMPRPGVVEHPDDDLWTSIGVASRRAIAGFTGNAADLAGIGLCTIRFCRALLRRDGTLAGPVMSWMDDRVSRRHEGSDPDVAWVTTSSGYITHRMTGQFRDTAANYQGMWPISSDRWEWLRDDEGFDRFGVPRQSLFELVLPGEVLGTVTEAAALHTGLPAGLPVVATANDKAVEALGCGLRSPGTLLVSLGTYIAGMSAGGENRAGETFWSNFGAVPHQYLYESGGIRRGMWAVSWWRDVLGTEVSIPAEALGIGAEQLLDEQAAARVPAGSDGLMVVLDWLAPTEAPYRKGSMLGFDARHGRLHVHRAILEGIAFTVQLRAAAMAGELGERFERLVVSGGGSRSALLMGILADVFGLPVQRCRVHGAAGLGAAICAAVGLGVHRSFDDAIEQMVAYEPAYTAEPRHHDLYQAIAPVYGGITALTDEHFRRAHPLFN